jgi:uncharacterized membrane protein
MTAGTDCIDVSQAAEFSLVARRNNSLSASGRLRVFVFVFAVSIGIACAFAIFGAWLILPFAGLEMLVLYLAFREIGRHAGDYERIAIGRDRVRVESCETGQLSHDELSRCWARVVASRDGRYLALRSHGRELAIGRHRSDEQRLELARALALELRGAQWGAKPANGHSR